MPSAFGNRSLSARHTALTWLERGCVFYDCETTGLGSHDVAIDIAVLSVDGRTLFESLITLPTGIGISDGALKTHGIRPEYLMAHGTPFPSVYDALWRVLTLKHVVAFNCAYDERIMYQTINAWGLSGIASESKGAYSWNCAMLLAQDAMDVRKWPRLEQAAERYNVKAMGAHRARVDAEVTRQIVMKIAGVI